MTTMRYGFGRATSPNAELLPAIELALSGGRTIRLVGQTELLAIDGSKRTSVIGMIGEADKRSRHHLRGALDHVVLAAAGIATSGHAHVLLPSEGLVRRVDHLAWTQDAAKQYLADLASELLDQPHGYLLPFDEMVVALVGGNTYATRQESRLGFGPVDRIDGLPRPSDGPQIARRRLLPLVDKMRGDHGFERSKSS